MTYLSVFLSFFYVIVLALLYFNLCVCLSSYLCYPPILLFFVSTAFLSLQFSLLLLLFLCLFLSFLLFPRPSSLFFLFHSLFLPFLLSLTLFRHCFIHSFLLSFFPFIPIFSISFPPVCLSVLLSTSFVSSFFLSFCLYVFLSLNFIYAFQGYGNAAGLLARKGLMGGTMGRRQNVDPDYSEDSEDSDTEDYKAVKDDINPVTG